MTGCQKIEIDQRLCRKSKPWNIQSNVTNARFEAERKIQQTCLWDVLCHDDYLAFGPCTLVLDQPGLTDKLIKSRHWDKVITITNFDVESKVDTKSLIDTDIKVNMPQQLFVINKRWS